ncbi:hypothetical protein HZC00_00430 [Candidatus Kaiserbacteria bacterium]|nr:hypothetical protein [Candidatus Kaiserbacteria bacterium]
MFEKHPDHFSFDWFQLDRVWHPALETWHFEDERFASKGVISFTGGQAIGGKRWIDETIFDNSLCTVSGLALAMADKAIAMELYMLDGVKAFTYSGKKTRDRLLRWGDMVQFWKGRLLTSIDVGTNADDMKIVGERTEFVTSNNPSPDTAEGLFGTICEVAKWRGKSLQGLSVLVTGACGGVGSEVVRMLCAMGVKVYGKDTTKDRAKIEAMEKIGVEFILDDHFPHVDIYAPCAIGGILNARTIPLLKEAGIWAVIGCANCQLEDGDKDAMRLHEAGILYAVDYFANGGGLLSAAQNLRLINDAEARIKRIGVTVVDIMEMSLSGNQNLPTTVVARNLLIKRKQARILTAA